MLLGIKAKEQIKLPIETLSNWSFRNSVFIFQLFDCSLTSKRKRRIEIGRFLWSLVHAHEYFNEQNRGKKTNNNNMAPH